MICSVPFQYEYSCLQFWKNFLIYLMNIYTSGASLHTSQFFCNTFHLLVLSCCIMGESVYSLLFSPNYFSSYWIFPFQQSLSNFCNLLRSVFMTETPFSTLRLTVSLRCYRWLISPKAFSHSVLYLEVAIAVVMLCPQGAGKGRMWKVYSSSC